MSSDLLGELKKLQYERSAKTPFVDQIDFLQWADQVQPRLSFDPKLAGAFRSAVVLVDSQRALRLPMDSAMNEAIGALNQAVIALQHNFSTIPNKDHKATKSALQAPKSLTLQWIWQNATWAVYVWLGSLVAAAFGAGAIFNELRTSIQSTSLTAAPQTTTAPTSANAVLTNKTNASTVTPKQ